MILACLNWAASPKVRLIAANPLRGKLELPEGGSRGGDSVWPPDVFQLVLANVNARFGDFLRALAWTGARPSTLRRIEAHHFRPALKVWDVEELYRGRTSNKKVVRRIWLSPQMVELVERLNGEWPEGPIFRNTKGKPYTADVITMMIQGPSAPADEEKKDRTAGGHHGEVRPWDWTTRGPFLWYDHWVYRSRRVRRRPALSSLVIRAIGLGRHIEALH